MDTFLTEGMYIIHGTIRFNDYYILFLNLNTMVYLDTIINSNK